MTGTFARAFRMKDYYHILGIKQFAAAKDIKKAYRRLALLYHPDKNPNNKESEEKFKIILEAYQILGDEEKRKSYDLFYEADFKFEDYRESPPKAYEYSYTRTKKTAKATPVEDKDIDVFSGKKFVLHQFNEYIKNLKSSYTESVISKKRTICPKCAGRGIRWLFVFCTNCNSAGYCYEINDKNYEICPACKGAGWGDVFFGECLCDYCQGQGVVKPKVSGGAACFHCGGFGWSLKDSLWRKILSFPYGAFICFKEECYICKGSGRNPQRKEKSPANWCPACQGYGWVGINFLQRKIICLRCMGRGWRKEKKV